MDISIVKDHIHVLEQKAIRLPVYHYLKHIWLNNDRTEGLAVLAMQQMVFYLIELESPWTVWEDEDEHQTYQVFLQEVLEYGFKHFIHGKMFMWNLCFYLRSIGTYHFILGKQIPLGSERTLLQQLLYSAKELYPTSVLFDVIPLVQDGDPLWKERISDEVKNSILAEVDEWKLRDNMVDEDMRELFGI